MFQAHTAVVLGAGGGIGRAACRAFAEAGAKVWALDISLEAATESIDALAGEHHCEELDVTHVAAVNALAERISSEKPADSVIYAPGVVFTADIAELDWRAYRRLMEINLDGAFYIAQAFVKPMLKASRPGSFVFLSSMAGKRGEAGASAYCASKFAMIGMVQSFAAETATRGVRVNAVCPGNVDTPMLRKVAEDMARLQEQTFEAVWQSFADVAAAKRLVTPEEVARTCLWLCSPAASAITGEAINVDAGALSG